MEEILHWIQYFYSARHTFTNGCCYWFAYLLKAEFGATIWYAPIEGHFVGEIDGVLYDVNGVYRPSAQDADKMLKWEALKAQDSLWAKHIERDCIHFKECDIE